MNIFCLDKDPEIAARQHCDKHCVKMILECNQLLCTTFWMQGLEAPYKKTHYNHPSAIWARESRGNFEWLVQHAAALLNEYTKRYGKRHKSTDTFIWILENKHRLHFDKQEQTEFAIAISQDQRCRKLPNFDELPVVEKYREYYNHDKSYMAKWQYSETPKWYTVK
tara:strand:- start:15259 stop:15756 length:498 start_codon:yes stop_codon:yes gene_type:complete